MDQFYAQFDSPDVLNSLEPEEVAFRILQFAKNERDNQGLVHIQNMDVNSQEQAEFQSCRNVIAEGWVWLENHGLLIPAGGSNGQSGFRVLSRRGEQIANDKDFREFQFSQSLQRDMLHELIRDRVWGDFIRGNFDAAVMHSFKTLEIYVRETAGYNNSAHGQALFQDAFRLAKNSNPAGPLTDQSLEASEQEGQRNLFVGAYSYFRNPNAHRNVDIGSADSALEIILLANQLFRIVDAAKARIAQEVG